MSANTDRDLRFAVASFVMGVTTAFSIYVAKRYLCTRKVSSAQSSSDDFAGGSRSEKGGRTFFPAVNEDHKPTVSRVPGGIGAFYESDTTEETSSNDDSEYERIENMRLKMVFVIRTDGPKMSPNVVARLTAGAGVGVVELIHSTLRTERMVDPTRAEKGVSPTSPTARKWIEWYQWWKSVGCAKIVLKCPDAETFERIATYAKSEALPFCLAGRLTCKPDEVLSGSAEHAVIAIGPVPSDEVDPVTGKLKLFN